MKTRHAASLLAIIASALSLSACTTAAWYQGMKISAENECRRRLSGDVERCLAQLNQKSYDDYEKERSGKSDAK
jgi:hypothetical protein